MAVRIDDVDLDRDRALVARFQSGDRAAFDELYRRYFDRLARYCERRVGDRHAAEEIAQDAFVRALSALPRLAGEQRFYPWMTVIAQRLCVDHSRKAGRVRPTEVIDLGAVEGADSDVLHRERAARVREALDRVTQRHRDVLVLREAEGLSYQAIADRLDAPVTTVETLLHRARRALRRELDVLVGPGGLVAVPVLGTALRAGRAMRQRLATRLPAHWPDLSPLAAPLAAAAVVVSVAAAPTVTPGAPAPPAPDRPAATSRATQGDAPGAPGPSSPAAADQAGPAPVSGEEPQAPAGDVTPAGEPPVEVWAGPEGARRAREETEKMPVTADAGPVFMGADPMRAIEDVADVAGTVLGVEE